MSVLNQFDTLLWLNLFHNLKLIIMLINRLAQTQVGVWYGTIIIFIIIYHGFLQTMPSTELGSKILFSM